jgi:predicted O-methyltransferase YrrM
LSVDEAEKAAAPIDGFVSVEEGRRLYELARNIRGSIVEVGSWKGRSTIWLAFGSRDGKGGKVFAVDPHAGSKEHAERGESSTLRDFLRNIESTGVSDQIIPMVMTSEEARRNIDCPIGLLFLDGPNEIGLVKAEVDRWCECLDDGSIMAIHDTLADIGPRKVAQHLYTSMKFADVQRIDSLTYATMLGHVTVAQKMSDIRRLIFITVETILGRFHYPAPIRAVGRRVLDALSK